jgi:hypothetical protein
VKEVKFELGRCVITGGADARLRAIKVDPIVLLRRHVTGDWIAMSRNDRAANHKAVKNGYRIFSAYTLTASNIKFYVITEHDRSYTTIMLACEY